MKAETFAKLIVLETLIDAEIGQFLESPPASMDTFREAMVARVSDLVDEIDALDAIAAARVYDAIVDFLAGLPEEPEGVIRSTLAFKRAMERIADRGMDRGEQDRAATWAVVLDELLDALNLAYCRAVDRDGSTQPQEYMRALILLARARQVADRMLWSARSERRTELRDQMDRLTFAVRHQRLPAADVELLLRPAQRRVRRYRPSSLSRVGAFVVAQLLRRRERGERTPRRGQGAGEQPATA